MGNSSDGGSGPYRGSYYTVKKGDTLYYIAYIADRDINEVIAMNRMEPPYTIYPGQKIKLWSPVYAPTPYAGTGSGRVGDATMASTSTVGSNSKAPTASVSQPVETGITASQTASSVVATTTAPVSVAPVVVPSTLPTKASPSNSSTSKGSSSKPSNNQSSKPSSNQSANAKTPTSKPSATQPPKTVAKSNTNQKRDTQKVENEKTRGYVNQKDTNKSNANKSQDNSKIDAWKWPTKGRVVKKFSSGEQGNKGIDIAGKRGQSVVSTANGSVVYSGSALRGYGNLVIVKHSDKYLSAYAHNDALLVKQGQSVTAGQKIATMGSTGTDNVRLHFEIRYQGKSVDPMRYLP